METLRETFEDILTGGHPNSLGRTIEVVDLVLAAPERLEDLIDTYRSTDEVVRLRTSTAIRRLEVARHNLVVPCIDRLIHEIGDLDQPSAQWTLAVLFDRLLPDMTSDQIAASAAVMKRNLAHHQDWIVLNNTMDTLTHWAGSDAGLKTWLLPHLERLTQDTRKSVKARATKFLAALTQT